MTFGCLEKTGSIFCQIGDSRESRPRYLISKTKHDSFLPLDSARVVFSSGEEFVRRLSSRSLALSLSLAGGAVLEAVFALSFYICTFASIGSFFLAPRRRVSFYEGWEIELDSARAFPLAELCQRFVAIARLPAAVPSRRFEPVYASPTVRVRVYIRETFRPRFSEE